MALSVSVVPQVCFEPGEFTPNELTDLVLTEATICALAEILSVMEAKPPEFDAIALAAISAAWSLLTEVDEEALLASFLHEIAPSNINAMIDSRAVFIFLKGFKCVCLRSTLDQPKGLIGLGKISVMFFITV